MEDDSGHLDQIDEALMTYDLSDKELEGAARVDGRPAKQLTACLIEQRNDWTSIGRGRSGLFDVCSPIQARSMVDL
jgi:hypothetical protein